jgi:hypothetical protein
MAVKSSLRVNSSGSLMLAQKIKHRPFLYGAVVAIGIIALCVAIACAVVFGINRNPAKTSVTTPVVTTIITVITRTATTTTTITTHPSKVLDIFLLRFRFLSQSR